MILVDKIKFILKKIPVLGDIVVPIYRRWNINISKPFDMPSVWIEKLIHEEVIQIVQIGSNDGKRGDPLYNLLIKNERWKALLVEPIPYLFERLKSNYGTNPRFSFENVVINDGSQQIFYWVREEAKESIPDLPDWYDQLGSFYKESILKHLNGILEPYIEETLLNGMTLTELLNKNKVDVIDIFHIDAEGYDWKILSQLNLKLFQPRIILFEHKHLMKTEVNESIAFLKPKYSIFKLGGDFICLNNDFFKKEEFKGFKGHFIA